MIAPAAAGGGLDAAARLVTDSLSRQLGQPFVVQNVAGLNIIGTAQAAKAPPDGYTILTATGGPIVLAPLLRNDVQYNAVTDLAPVGLINESVSVLVVNQSKIQAKTLAELLQAVKAKPDGFDYGSNGIGTESHLYMELLMLRAGVKLRHVPYKSGADQMTAVVAGEVPIAFINSSTAVPQVVQGAVRALGVVSAGRLAEIPDVPPINDTVPNFGGYSTWQGVFAPAGIPKPIVDRLSVALKAYNDTPDAAAAMRKIGSVPRSAAPEQFADIIRKESATWGEVIKAANIKIE